MAQLFRTTALRIFFGIAGTIILAIIAEWCIEVARDKGFFADAGERWDLAMSAVTGFIVSGWVLYPLGVLGGFVAGLWVDKWLRTYDAMRESPPTLPMGAALVSASQSGGLIAPEDKQSLVPGGVVLSCRRHKHDLDITPLVSITNRSANHEKIGRLKWDYRLMGEEPPTRAGVSISDTIAKEASQAIRLTESRFYTLPEQRPVEVFISIAFGRSKDQLNTRLSFRITGNMPNPLPDGETFRCKLQQTQLIEHNYAPEPSPTPETQTGLR